MYFDVKYNLNQAHYQNWITSSLQLFITDSKADTIGYFMSKRFGQRTVFHSYPMRQLCDIIIGYIRVGDETKEITNRLSTHIKSLCRGNQAMDD
jgi:hypothetical protein